jgi:hypothetical protein
LIGARPARTTPAPLGALDEPASAGSIAGVIKVSRLRAQSAIGPGAFRLALPMAFPVIFAVIFAVGLVLTSCGTDSSPAGKGVDEGPSTAAASAPPDESPSTSAGATASATAQPPSWPDCTTIWVAGNSLPRGYRGCLDGQTRVPADPRYCSIGGRLVTYDNKFYAMVRGPINQAAGRLANDDGFRQASAACGA